ncbi:MAG: GTP-binding protein, partial [Bacteroidetes bacterium]|nr:GTP-binding protein [Bacteroidota bacterium]
ISLRPRFKMELNQSNEYLLKVFEKKGQEQSGFNILRVDDHVFIKIPSEKQHFWSPQLDLEIIDNENNTATLHGLFGPKPVVWTLFMFLHFIVGTLFLGSAVWAYSNYSLDKPFALQLTGMLLLLIAWFVLYFAGRMGKHAGKKEMRSLHEFLLETLAT